LRSFEGWLLSFEGWLLSFEGGRLRSELRSFECYLLAISAI
jgi:hypothetical protein